MKDSDVCECGDFRKQHEGGVGKCMLAEQCSPTPCQRFRLAGAPKIGQRLPMPPRKLDIRPAFTGAGKPSFKPARKGNR